jgi:peroxiredoxin
MLTKNDRAPDFELFYTPDQQMTLHQLKGKNVVLAFYPADWSPVCSDQMSLYNEMLQLFRGHNAELLGISVDSKWCHAAFARARKLQFPLLADFHPQGETARKYGVYNEQDGVCNRALFVIDGEGIIRWSYLSPTGTNPGAEGILSALESITHQNETYAAADTTGR